MIKRLPHPVETYLSEVMGLDPESLGRKSFERALQAAMARAGIDDLDSYLPSLKGNAGEMEKLVEQLVVPETWFFRDMEAFNFLRTRLEEGQLPGGKPLRLLSVPCSTGEEPYSIAMVLLAMAMPGKDFRIDAVDISRRNIEVARRAVYGKASFREKSAAYEERYFTRSPEGYSLERGVADFVHFFQANFVMPDALAQHEPYHVVFCKNLLIYLTNDARQRVFANLDRLLLPGGLLFTGHSEMISFLQNGYRPVRHERAFACVKAQGGPARRPPTTEKRSTLSRKTATLSVPVRAKGNGTMRPAIGNDEAAPGGGERPEPTTALDEIRQRADRGELDEALRQCEQFLERRNAEKEAFYLMGLIHLSRDSYGQAELFLQKALYMDPHYYDALVQMELLYEKKGDRAQAALMKQRIGRSAKIADQRPETP